MRDGMREGGGSGGGGSGGGGGNARSGGGRNNNNNGNSNNNNNNNNNSGGNNNSSAGGRRGDEAVHGAGIERRTDALLEEFKTNKNRKFEFKVGKAPASERCGVAFFSGSWLGTEVLKCSCQL